MATLPSDFRDEFHERLLDLLWSQWTAMGVMGNAMPSGKTVLDPEALVLITCTVGRRDPRLFDAMMDWLRINGRYLNVQRLRRILATYPFAGSQVFAAIAATVSTAGQAAKWARSAKPVRGMAPEPLFRMEDGEPLPLLRDPDPVFLSHGFRRDRHNPRGVARPFSPELAANLLLRLRAFLGINARCEILAYLLLHPQGSPRAIARACGYYPATITKAMADMAESGLVASRIEGRLHHYSLDPAWRTLLLAQESSAWIVWPALFSALEQAWTFLQVPERKRESALAQASALRRVLGKSILKPLAVCELPLILGDPARSPGEKLIPFFVTQMRETLAAIRQLD
jgi:DNA-binding transcriptional ArsR family regulator